MSTTPSITEAEFEFLTRRAGLELGAAQLAEMYAAYAHIEQMARSVRTQRAMDSEPAHIFVAAKKGE